MSLTNTWASVVFWSGEAKNLWVKWCFCDLGGDSSSTLVVFARGGVISISSDSSDLDWDDLGEFGELDEVGRYVVVVKWWTVYVVRLYQVDYLKLRFLQEKGTGNEAQLLIIISIVSVLNQNFRNYLSHLLS